MGRFSIAVLCYGPHLQLARRCLGSIRTQDWSRIQDVRIGLNAVQPETRDYVQSWRDQVPVPVHVLDCPTNPGKYPVMRRLFFDPNLPPLAELVLWMDDDSCLVPGGNCVFDYLAVALRDRGAAMLGKLYRRVKPLGADQRLWLARQPWWCNRPLQEPVRFLTGGWWILDRTVINQWNWPPIEAQHNGGDYTLGVLLQQQGLKMVDWPDSFWVNAGESGKPSSAKRRGISSAQLGTRATWGPPFPHQEFEHRWLSAGPPATTGLV